MPITVRDLHAFKERGERFIMLTAYDASMARLLDRAGVPVLLVGDTLGEVMLGHSSTVPVTMDDMIHHATAVTRAVENAFVVGDMPFMSYQASTIEALNNAGRHLKEAGVNAVKLEGGGRITEVVNRMVEAGIPVMGHLGLTPQSVHQLGGYPCRGGVRPPRGFCRMPRISRLRAHSLWCWRRFPRRSGARSPKAFRSLRSASAWALTVTPRCWYCTTFSASRRDARRGLSSVMHRWETRSRVRSRSSPGRSRRVPSPTPSTPTTNPMAKPATMPAE